MPATAAKAAAKAAPKAAAKRAPKKPALAVQVVTARVGTHVVHLSDPEMKQAMDEIKRRIREEPGYKISLLQSAGIVNAKGKLTKLYSGR